METRDPLEGQIANLDYLEKMYQEFQAHPAEVDPSWPQFFKEIGEAKSLPAAPGLSASRAERIVQLAEAYRRHGHLLANINPIAKETPPEPPELNLRNLGFQPAEEQELFPSLGLLPQAEASLQSIVEVLKKRYCQTVGFEFKDFTEPKIEAWMQEQIESGLFDLPFTAEEKKVILSLLTRAEVLETFLNTKHVGKTRFSLEGAESLIPMLAFMIAKGAEEGVEEIFIGMSHRGRLNVLANLFNKPVSSILRDFDDEYEPSSGEGMGDIRYHKGHDDEAVDTYKGKKIKLIMAPNPSHLESVNPVVEGEVHARQFLARDEKERNRIIPLLLHGDAALSGQGIVYETLQMSKLPGFETGGTLHVVVNNQIGFTTTPQEGRSTRYCTDIAHTFSAPVFHLNAEDPETCIRAALMALDMRQRFHADPFLDFNCYRKYGHNEGDEPAFTQPIEYQIIRKKRSIRSLYIDQLIKEGVIDQKGVEEMEENFRKELSEAYASRETSRKEEREEATSRAVSSVETSVALEQLREAAESLAKTPSNFHIHPKLDHLMKERSKAVLEDKPFDWGTAEFLAYGTLCMEGIPVRLAGQDSGRGTFSHRHALLIDQEDSHAYYPLAHLSESQGRFEVLNTCLSEAAALGFEYGYSVICRKGLTIWEAQYGDFANSAQVIIDQYIVSGEQKWGQRSSLVLFLPHGMEGQGPEHSSGRLERYLTLAGHDNMQIVIPTLPAQLFHLLRRQVKQPFRKPLIVFMPKALLRHPSSTSTVSDLVQGHFNPFLDDPRQPKQAQRLLLCSGRVYYDLDAYRQKEKREDVAIIRLEQLYPFDAEGLRKLIAVYSGIKECLWVQEEPKNMGPWPFVSSHLCKVLPSNLPFRYVGRDYSATPATGFYARHKKELANILQQVFQT